MSAALETTIGNIWRELLGVDTIDPDQNFFDLGGNSLLMIQFHSRLQTVLGTAVPLVQLFERPTIRSLAESLPVDERHIRSSVQLTRVAHAHPLRPPDGQAADSIDERARKQLAARAQLRARATDATGR